MNKFKLFLTAVFLMMQVSAHAGDLTGQSGTLDYLYPDTSTIFSTDAFTVPQTVLTLTYGPNIVNQITGTGIHITFGNLPYDFSSAAFNGEQFIFPGVSLVTPIMTTDFAGVTMTSDAHDIWINWQGLTPNSDSFVDIKTSSSVPEPTTMLLFGAGLAGIAVVRRKNA